MDDSMLKKTLSCVMAPILGHAIEVSSAPQSTWLRNTACQKSPEVLAQHRERAQRWQTELERQDHTSSWDSCISRELYLSEKFTETSPSEGRKYNVRFVQF